MTCHVSREYTYGYHWCQFLVTQNAGRFSTSLSNLHVKESRGHLSVRSSTRFILEANCSIAQVDLFSADSLVCVLVLFLQSDFMSVDFDPSPPLTVFRSTISSYHITVKIPLLNLMSCCLHLSTLSLWSPLLVSLSTHLENVCLLWNDKARAK